MATDNPTPVTVPAVEPEPAAADRIRAAIAGRPAKGYVGVDPADVLAVAAKVPPTKQTAYTAALAKGARDAPQQKNDDGDPLPCVVYPEAGKLAHLLEMAGDPR